ncbi:cation:proton antiporter [Serratia ureilytica]|nr:cation:proton antiporter [Serratia ureilytica]
MSGVFFFETTISVILIVIMMNWLSVKIKISSSVVLIVGGGILAFMPNLPDVVFEPELILLILLPPLLMDGAYFTAVASFRQHISGILLLALGAVLFTTLCIGVVAHLLIPMLPWAACFVLGAIVSPPDAVSARAILNKVKLPSRITTLLEGESLLNDASGLVLFRMAVAATLCGVFSFKNAAMDFVLLLLGGVLGVQCP